MRINIRFKSVETSSKKLMPLYLPGSLHALKRNYDAVIYTDFDQEADRKA